MISRVFAYVTLVNNSAPSGWKSPLYEYALSIVLRSVFRAKDTSSLFVVRLALPADFRQFLKYDDLMTLRFECMGSTQARWSSTNDADGVVFLLYIRPCMEAEPGNDQSDRQ